MRPIVHSVKHYVQFPIDQIATGTIQNIIIADAVESTAANAANEVEEGTIIKAVQIQLLLQNQGNLGEFIVVVEKGVANTGGVLFVQAAALFGYPNKKNVLFVSQGLTSNDGVGNPQQILGPNDWIKIPKSKQRMGLGDRIILSIANVSAGDLNRCGKAVYKEMS